MAWEENPRICLHMQLIAILSRTGVILQLGCKSFPLILHRQSTNECTDLIIIKKNESQKE